MKNCKQLSLRRKISAASILHNQKPIPDQSLLAQGSLPYSTDLHKKKHYTRYCQHYQSLLYKTEALPVFRTNSITDTYFSFHTNFIVFTISTPQRTKYFLYYLK